MYDRYQFCGEALSPTDVSDTIVEQKSKLFQVEQTMAFDWQWTNPCFVLMGIPSLDYRHITIIKAATQPYLGKISLNDESFWGWIVHTCKPVKAGCMGQ